MILIQTQIIRTWLAMMVICVRVLDCPRLPPFHPFRLRPLPVFEINPFLVAMSVTLTFNRYLSHPTLIDGLPGDTLLLMDKTLKLREVLDWKFRGKWRDAAQI